MTTTQPFQRPFQRLAAMAKAVSSGSRAIGRCSGSCASVAHLTTPLLRALRRFLTGAASLVVPIPLLQRAICSASQLQTGLEKDLLLETDLAARGRRAGKKCFADHLAQPILQSQRQSKPPRAQLGTVQGQIRQPHRVAVGGGGCPWRPNHKQSQCGILVSRVRNCRFGAGSHFARECLRDAGHIRPHLVGHEQAGCPQVCAGRATRVRRRQAPARRSVHAIAIQLA